jgi:hypothetical protein
VQVGYRALAHEAGGFYIYRDGRWTRDGGEKGS